MMLPRLYAIADRETLDARGMTVGAFAEELRDGGVRLLQYRDKRNGPQQILQAAGQISEVFAGVEAMLVLNDRADLAGLLGWGVHVGQGDLPVGEAKTVMLRMMPALATKEPSRRWGTPMVGASTHSAEQVKGAVASGADYVAIGPAFATLTKLNPEPVVGLEGVRQARALTSMPLVAIGGITLANACSVLEAGADCVAVIGGLFVPGRSVREVAGDFLHLLR